MLMQLRLVLKMLLESKFGEVLVTLGVCCSSWVLTARGSTKRSLLTPMGCDHYPSVALANKMVSRPGKKETLWNVIRTNDMKCILVNGFVLK